MTALSLEIQRRESIQVARTRDATIDLLRAACILYIVGYWHLVPYTQAFPSYANSVTEGIKDTALGTFVFCSGLLLAGRRVALTGAALVEFYQRRVLRIYPLYVAALLLFGATGLADHDLILNAMLLLPMFNPPALYTLWFVSMMMMFYLLTPLLVRLADFPRLYLLVSCAFVVGVIFVHKQLHPLDTRLIQYLPCFLFGVAYKRMVRLEPFFKSLALWWWLLLIPAFYLYQLQQGAGDIAALGRIPLVLLGTLLLFYAATPLAKHSPTTLLLRISYASFCLYLFHRVIFQWSIDLYFPNNGYMRLVYLLGLVLPAMVVISYYLQWAYDRGIQKLRL